MYNSWITFFIDLLLIIVFVSVKPQPIFSKRFHLDSSPCIKRFWVKVQPMCGWLDVETVEMVVQGHIIHLHIQIFYDNSFLGTNLNMTEIFMSDQRWWNEKEFIFTPAIDLIKDIQIRDFLLIVLVCKGTRSNAYLIANPAKR